MISSVNHPTGSRPVAAGDTPWARLKQFLLTSHHAIMASEQTSESLIHLYSLGDWWLAFDRSAHRLCTIFPDAPVSVFRFPDSDTPMTMAHISADAFKNLIAGHASRVISSDHIVVSAARNNSEEDQQW